MHYKAWLVCAFIAAPASVSALETSTELALETQVFNHDSVSASDGRLGVSLQPHLSHKSKTGDTLSTFEPFLRWDSEDKQRSHADIRELNILHTFSDWELQAGITKVFWGVAESNHLVDVINQTDYLEGLDGEDKLGQPLVRLSRIYDQITLDALVLPSFRERQFLGPDSRFYLGVNVNENAAFYEASSGQRHTDYALRLSGYQGQIDFGLSWFKGTSRQAQLIPVNPAGTEFAAFYPQMRQWGLDLQFTFDAWLWKLEALHNSQSTGRYKAAVGGFEYTIYGLKQGGLDLGLLAELHHDSRNDAGLVNWQNDLFLGARIAMTDAASSELLFGGFIDFDDYSRSFRIEGSRRVFTDAKIALEVQVFDRTATGNIAYGFRNNDFVKLELQWYF